MSEGDVDKRTTLNYRVVNETGNGDYPSGQSTTRQRRDPPGQRVSHSDGHYSQTVSSIDSPKGAGMCHVVTISDFSHVSVIKRPW